MTRTGDREIGVVSGRLPDNPGELACMGSVICETFAPFLLLDECMATSSAPKMLESFSIMAIDLWVLSTYDTLPISLRI